jgi:hypothetical protein
VWSDAELIQAKVPILKFRDVRNGLQVDLNCNNVVGIRNTELLYSFSKSKSTFTILPDLSCFQIIFVKPDHKNKKPRHVAENPWN